jgi:hypothetical protein
MEALRINATKFLFSSNLTKEAELEPIGTKNIFKVKDLARNK